MKDEAWEEAMRGLPSLAEESRTRRAEPKPSRFARKAADRTERRKAKTARDKFRTRIYVLDMGKCRCCKRKVYLKVVDAPHELAVGHVHEWVKRSQGGSDVDPLNSLLLCAECHDAFGNKENIVPLDPAKLMRGEVEFMPSPPLQKVT